MARILFGVSGDGIGHATRSKATVDHLIESGHEVRLVSSNKGYDYLSNYYDVVKIFGLQISNKDGEVVILDTVNELSLSLLKHGFPTIEKLVKLADNFKPELVISDFEPFVSIVSRLRKIPLISIDNQHVITHCNIQYPRAWRSDYLIAQTVCKAINNFAQHYFITSFFAPKPKRKAQDKVTVIGPILRKEILQQVPGTGNHIIVYMRSPERAGSISSLLERMESNIFFMYGSNSGLLHSRNITFKESDIEGFYQDLANAQAVITNGGHSLISESLFLGKPIYSIPTKKDFEQMSNAYYVEKLGYGIYELEPTISNMLKFLSNLETYRVNIKKDSNNFNGNEVFYRTLDSKIQSILFPGIKPLRLKTSLLKKEGI